MADRKLLVYVAGPYRAETGVKVRENIARAAEVFVELLKRGYAAVCPHTMTAEMEYLHPEVEDRVWLTMELEIVTRVDAVILVEGWEHSTGTAAEIAEASRFGIPVFHSLEELEKYRCPDLYA